jgi:hypothetical protein
MVQWKLSTLYIYDNYWINVMPMFGFKMPTLIFWVFYHDIKGCPINVDGYNYKIKKKIYLCHFCHATPMGDVVP